MKLPRNTSKSFKILEFIAGHDGVRHGDISRFICEISGRDYDVKETVRVWERNVPYDKRKTRSIRVNRGYWQTNLFYGPQSLMRKYCVKGMNGLWYVSPWTANALSSLYDQKGIGHRVYFTNDPNSTQPAVGSITSTTGDFMENAVPANKTPRNVLRQYADTNMTYTDKTGVIFTGLVTVYDDGSTMVSYVRDRSTPTPEPKKENSIDQAIADLAAARAKMAAADQALNEARLAFDQANIDETNARELVRTLLDL